MNKYEVMRLAFLCDLYIENRAKLTHHRRRKQADLSELEDHILKMAEQCNVKGKNIVTLAYNLEKWCDKWLHGLEEYQRKGMNK